MNERKKRKQERMNERMDVVKRTKEIKNRYFNEEQKNQ